VGHEHLRADVRRHDSLQYRVDARLHLRVRAAPAERKLPEAREEVLLEVALLGDDVPQQAGKVPILGRRSRSLAVFEIGHIGGVALRQAADAGVEGQPIGQLLEEAHAAGEADA